MSLEKKSDTDEIDLLDLLVQLWKGKKTIIVSVCITTILAVGYIAVAKEKWTSIAIITPPQLGQLADYPTAVAVIDPSNSKDISNDVFANFVSRFSAETLKFLPEKPLDIKPTNPGSKDSFTVSFSAETAKDAQKSLATVLNTVNKQTSSSFYSNAEKALEVRMQAINTALDAQVKTAEEKKARRLNALSEALKVAEATNTKSVSVKEVTGLSDEMLFMLGEPALKTIIANETSWPLYLSDSYYSNRETLQALREIKLSDSGNDKFEAFSFSQQPSLPIIKDAPKKSLILILSVLLGGLIGAGIVLCKGLIRNIKEKNSAA
ncbi:LPS O-antigen chain length determinant protein WzzB [Obesumbacterium proteus]|uniref:LPS O-antigen chain length determinant protein WzzB n=1 Tax=Obesumbacterium proteus TaxID=82983 RepID=UPI001F232D66|nr:LPS O-antigen chain length determinant protein WzzB [Obesumbacterium proteus]MCE9884797.1 LPS O-antigen chain length determinant protein WzzB [Obesumbacterium proteus]MCE9916108.1 LPS O-antigen chain length determinant protein WzzB [Obesumbacterium proteus]MCE9931306.1 LPS O-antigen chain length determinant protein WzzB [Obesumbacterium proteus]MCG2877634.1 LPS O-antigen chain length determinant protein WzzB [Obesumbacterium proteus]